ncbi:MAG: copper transporter [Firmicutes bacterium]|nr:copper transporter [Bacillota bacterium]
MISPRYHVASTIAVFFALGLGIFLGSIIVKDDTLVRHQQSLIDEIESEFTLIRQDREALHQRLAATEAQLKDSIGFAETMLPRLVSHKLEGKSVAVVVPANGLSRDETELLTATLRDAGASISNVVHISKRLQPVSPEDTEELKNRFGLDKNSSGAVGQRLADSIAWLVTYGDPSHFPEADLLFYSEYLEMDSFNEARCDAVIIAGGSNDPAHTPHNTDILLIKAFQRLNVPAVIVESQNVSFSFMDDYRLLGIPTIKQINTPMGRLSLIEELAPIVEGT